MIKEKRLSVYKDHKTGFLCKLCIVLGAILIIIGGIDTFILHVLGENIQSSLIALAVIIIFLGVIFYFFHCQFAKLATIAREIENEDVD